MSNQQGKHQERNPCLHPTTSPTAQCSWTEPKLSAEGAGRGGFGSALFVAPPSSSCWLVFRLHQTHCSQALPLSCALPALSHLSRPLLDPFHFLGILCEGGQWPQCQHSRQSLANPKQRDIPPDLQGVATWLPAPTDTQGYSARAEACPC